MAQLASSIPSLPLRVLTPSPTVLPDRIQRTLSHQPIVFRPTDTSCFHETPGGLVRLSKVLLLSLHESHLPLARLRLPQVSSSKTRQREQWFVRTFTVHNCQFRIVQVSLIADATVVRCGELSLTGGCLSKSRSCCRLRALGCNPGVPWARWCRSTEPRSSP